MFNFISLVPDTVVCVACGSPPGSVPRATCKCGWFIHSFCCQYLHAKYDIRFTANTCMRCSPSSPLWNLYGSHDASSPHMVCRDPVATLPADVCTHVMSTVCPSCKWSTCTAIGCSNGPASKDDARCVDCMKGKSMSPEVGPV